MRVDYLQDAPPETLIRIRETLSLPEVRVLAASVAAAAAVIAGAWSLGGLHLRQEQAAVRVLEARVARGTVDAARVKGELRALRGEETFERQLRGVRDSGAKAAQQLALLANRLPRGTWLTSVTLSGRRTSLVGRATTLQNVSRMLSVLPNAALESVRAGSSTRERTLEYRADASEIVR